MDVLTKRQRSYNMSRIKNKNTSPEIILRKKLWGYGVRGSRTKSTITGNPDFYFPSQKLAVFVDGCFWHRCPRCFIKPQSNKLFWGKKIGRNIERDGEVKKHLKSEGITVLRFWEHEIHANPDRVAGIIIKSL